MHRNWDSKTVSFLSKYIMQHQSCKPFDANTGFQIRDFYFTTLQTDFNIS